MPTIAGNNHYNYANNCLIWLTEGWKVFEDKTRKTKRYSIRNEGDERRFSRQLFVSLYNDKVIGLEYADRRYNVYFYTGKTPVCLKEGFAPQPATKFSDSYKSKGVLSLYGFPYNKVKYTLAREHGEGRVNIPYYKKYLLMKGKEYKSGRRRPNLNYEENDADNPWFHLIQRLIDNLEDI